MTAQEIIKGIMKKEGVSQHGLAAMLGISRSALSTMIAPSRQMMTDSIVKFVRVMGGEVIIRFDEDYSLGEITEKDVITLKRKEMGWSYQRIADECGYKRRQNVERPMNNKTSLRIDTLLRIVQVLGGKVIIKHKGEEYEISDRVCEGIDPGAE